MSFLSGFYSIVGEMAGSAISSSSLQKAEERLNQMVREGEISPKEARAKMQEFRAKRDSLMDCKEKLKQMAQEERKKR